MGKEKGILKKNLVFESDHNLIVEQINACRHCEDFGAFTRLKLDLASYTHSSYTPVVIHKSFNSPTHLF